MLKTTYKDEILQPGETHRTYNIVQNGRAIYSNVHFEKAYTPRQEGDVYSAGDVNNQNNEINRLGADKANKSELGNQVTFQLVGDTLYIRRK